MSTSNGLIKGVISAMMVYLVFIAMILIAVFMWAALNRARAHDMDEPNAGWYRSLMVPGTENSHGFGVGGLPCCSGGRGDPNDDCKNVDTRPVTDADGSVHWEAFASSKLFPDTPTASMQGHAPDAWVRVPDEAILHGKNNPTDAPVGCWYMRRWRCFIEGSSS